MSEVSLSQKSIDVLFVINDLGFANATQIQDILAISEKTVRVCIQNLLVAKAIVKVGYPSVPQFHPLRGLYYACTSYSICKSVLGEAFSLKKTYSSIFAHTFSGTSTPGIIFSKASSGKGKVTERKLSLHSGLVNYCSAWVIKTARERIGWNFSFEGERIIRNVRKWHYGRISSLADKSKGSAIPVPDFLLLKDSRILCCEVELFPKSQERYQEYYDHIDPNFSILYLVPHPDVATTILSKIPSGFRVGYCVISDSDTLCEELIDLLPY